MHSRTEHYLALLFSFVVISLLGNSHAIAQQTHGGAIDFRRVELRMGTLEVRLSGLAPESKWVFAVKVDAKAPRNQIAVTQLTRGVRCGGCIESTEDWPLSSIQISTGLVSITGLETAKRPLMIYLIVKQSVNLSIDSSNRPLFVGEVTDTLVIRDGVMHGTTLRGPTHAMSLATDSRTPQPEIQRMPDGHYYVNPHNFRTHLTTFELPAASPRNQRAGSECCVAGATAFLILAIDVNGFPTVVSRKGDPALVRALESAIAIWRFKPFLVGGAPTTVRSVVTALISKDGAIHLSEMEQ